MEEGGGAGIYADSFFITMEIKNCYVPPMVEVLEVSVEQGFEGSGGGFVIPEWDII